MKIIREINQIKKYRKPVVALGVFDGVHLGHRIILRNVVAKAHSIKGTSVVVTFWPHPQKEESLYSLEHRLRLIEELGIDICIVIAFNKQFARISAISFVEDILLKKVGVQYVYVGKNFRFGRNASGDLQLLQKLSRIHNFKLRHFNVVRINHRPISSTYIRRLIKRGDLANATKLLTRPISILGTVIRGTAFARRFGFPTANIDPHHEIFPPKGIYAVKIILENSKFNGICYIGSRPTMNARNRKVHIEVHIFGFKKNIYGKYLEIQFIKKIRNDKKFSRVSLLVKQIQKDTILTKTLFSLH